MPRLTTERYLSYYEVLHHFWQTDPTIFSRLTPSEQWDLHDYFQCYKSLNEAQLREHRKAISKDDPSLAHRAGRAFRNFLDVVEVMRQPAPVEQPGPKMVKVYALVEPEMNTVQLARAFIAIAKQMREAGD